MCLNGIVVLALAASVACGYSLAGRGSFLPLDIKTIGIPNFINRTTVFNLETQLTQKVRSEFIGRGRYQILPDGTNVDALLTGEVSNVSLIPQSFTGTALASRYVITMTARGGDVSQTMQVRTTVETSQVWGFVGIGLIVLVVLGLFLVFRRYGRR